MKEALAGAALTVVLAAGAFAGVRTAGFVQDDVPIVQLNPIVREGSVAKIFATDWWAGVGGQDASLYRPVTLWSFAAQRGADGSVSAAAAHLGNLAIHIVVSLLVLALGLRLGLGPRLASAAAILFAVHPVHTAAVAGLVGRAELLAALFTLAAVLLYSVAGRWPHSGLGPTDPGPGLRRAGAWGAAICVFLASGSKETGLVVPVLLVVLETLFRPRPRDPVVPRVAALAPTCLAVASIFVLRLHALDAFPGLQRVNTYENPIVALGGIERIATALGLLGRYAALLFWPARLSADYSGHAIAVESSLFGGWPLLGSLALALVLCLARRVFAAWLVLIPYLVVANLFFPVGQIFAERFIYVSSIGFCLLVPIGAAAAATRLPRLSGLLPRLGFAAMVVLALAGVVRTHAAVRDWQTDETLYEAARRAVPEAPRASFTLAKIRIEQGRTDEALALLEETLALWPEQSGAWVDKGTILARRGDLAGAEQAFRRAARINPNNARAVVSFGLALSGLGRVDEAERVLRIATRRFPGESVARDELARLAAMRAP